MIKLSLSKKKTQKQRERNEIYLISEMNDLKKTI